MSHWIVSLSDGQRISEGKLDDGLVKDHPNKISAWMYLKKHYLEKGIKVTQVQVVAKNNRYNSPTIKTGISINNLFAARKLQVAMGADRRGNQIDFIGFSYRDGKYRHHTWINEKTLETKTEVTLIELKHEAKIGYAE